MCQDVATGGIGLKAVRELQEEHFWIPNYQRGYRWSKRQVTDLLDDIWEFGQNSVGGIYCIQPLVVSRRKRQNSLERIRKLLDEQETPDLLTRIQGELKPVWEVIDGQQRLTTIHLMLSYLNAKQGQQSNSYEIAYETRPNSVDYLKNIAIRCCQDTQHDNIDFFHMRQAYQTIQNWFGNGPCEVVTFQKILLERVAFIWYESVECNPIEVFTRLNIGKIPLTDAELVKALFLNSSNFRAVGSESSVRLQQQEIAAEWDRIEFSLQQDEFWLFLHDTGYAKPTRIDFILELIMQQNALQLDDEDRTSLGTDEHQIFRYFYRYFHLHREDIQEHKEGFRLRDDLWHEVKRIFQIFEEWFNDLELYHYIGYLVEERGKGVIRELLGAWQDDKTRTKSAFREELRKKIMATLNACSDLTQPYDQPKGPPKSACRPLLLLFNLQTVINQNRKLVEDDRYGIGACYKFPFHLFKLEGKKANGKGWEIEHIASSAGDDLDKAANQAMYLASVAYALPSGEPLVQEIKSFLDAGERKPADDKQFNDLFEKVRTYQQEVNPALPEAWKNLICNYALLDSGTNEEYHNSPFPIKRICILAKDEGQKASLKYEAERGPYIAREAGVAFVPPCTRAVFTKAYTDVPVSLNEWTREDALAYLQKLYAVLNEAGFLAPRTEPMIDLDGKRVPDWGKILSDSIQKMER